MVILFTFLIAGLMISRIPMFSFKKIRVRRRLVAPPALSPGGVGRTAALHVNHGSSTCFVRTHCTHRRKVRRKQIRRPRRPGFVPRTNW
jgi:hypothetical protein